MKIIDILKQDTLSMSFEVFPPKTDAAFASVKAATEEIAQLKPAFMSVTYGAGGGTSAYTLEIARNIEQQYHVPMLAHLTCVSSTREMVADRIAAMKAAGIENVMALRGDLTPEMEGKDRSGWAYRHAVELIRELVESGSECFILHNATKNEDYKVLLPLTERQKGCILCGGLLNYTREMNK